MDERKIYAMLRDIVSSLELEDSNPALLPKEYEPDKSLEESGISLLDFPDIAQEMKSRLGGKSLGLEPFLIPEEFGYFTFRNFTEAVITSSGNPVANPIVVYVDDEEENLFIFRRKIGSQVNLKTFSDPLQALEFIRINNDVVLVITDEVMPGLSGNNLCDAVHESKPNLKFILITGNPDSDEDLMYRSLRQNRFYEFINKPLDFERKGKEYLEMIQRVTAGFKR